MNIYAILIASAIAFGAGWQVNGWRLNAKIDSIKLGYANALNTSIQRARESEQGWEAKLNQERDNAAKREIQLRADADSAHHANDGLRLQLSDTARRIAQATPATVADTAVALSELLGNCTDQYLDVAEKAQRHASDVETLIKSWPN